MIIWLYFYNYICNLIFKWFGRKNKPRYPHSWTHMWIGRYSKCSNRLIVEPRWTRFLLYVENYNKKLGGTPCMCQALFFFTELISHYLKLHFSLLAFWFFVPPTKMKSRDFCHVLGYPQYLEQCLVQNRHSTVIQWMNKCII